MKVKLTGKITHDGQLRNVGDILNIADTAAQRLIKYGVATSVGKKPTGTTEPNENLDKVPDEKSSNESGNESGNESDEDSDDELNENSGEGVGDIFNVKTDIDTMTTDAIAQELSIRGIGFKSNAKREQLVALLKKAIG
jgi:hypothetical protein